MGIPTTSPLFEQWHNFGFIVSEAPGHYSRDAITLIGAANLYAGTVLGQITSGQSATVASLGTNVGNGTVGTVSFVSTPSQPGPYFVSMTSATAFTVTAPDGTTAAGTVGTAFSALGIGFTLTAGGTAFVAGDSFTLTVTQGIGANTVASAAGATNSGNGTVGSLSVGGLVASPGPYTLEFDSATQYIVSNPAGQEIGHGVVGTAFSAGGLSFTVTAGGTAFAPADSFVITVAPGSGLWKTWDPANADGSQVVAGILMGTKYALATGANLPGVALTRQAEVNGTELLWPANMSAAEIALGVAGLKNLGIIVR